MIKQQQTSLPVKHRYKTMQNKTLKAENAQALSFKPNHPIIRKPNLNPNTPEQKQREREIERELHNITNHTHTQTQELLHPPPQTAVRPLRAAADGGFRVFGSLALARLRGHPLDLAQETCGQPKTGSSGLFCSVDLDVGVVCKSFVSAYVLLKNMTRLTCCLRHPSGARDSSGLETRL